MNRARLSAAFAARLLAWFERSGRSGLPWRTRRDPYRVVVSEFMLQQTQVERVMPIFERFVGRWPSFTALAGASQADVVRAWKGLGYNARAIRLHKLARAVCERFEGELPRDQALLRELPGVGPYTARAVAAFAFNDDAVAVDTNVRRIVHRTQLGLEWPPRAGPAEVDALAGALLPPGRAFAFNSALMDLGATICGARAPKCLLCPLRELCAAAPVDARALAAAAAEHARAAPPGKRVRFEETRRYVRGRVVDRLRELPAGRRVSFMDLAAALSGELPHHDATALEGIVTVLASEGVVDRTEGGIRLAQ